MEKRCGNEEIHIVSHAKEWGEVELGHGKCHAVCHAGNAIGVDKESALEMMMPAYSSRILLKTVYVPGDIFEEDLQWRTAQRVNQSPE